MVAVKDKRGIDHSLFEFPIFKITKPTTSKSYTADQSGFIGFGPYTANKGT